MVMTSNPKIMGRFTLPRGLWIMGWLATIAMLVAAAGMIFAQNS
jgi:Mn2+/Fe2+ NRAMP family transporter